MAESDYKDPPFVAEDPELTSQSHWRWALPILLLVALPVVGVYALRETTGDAPRPSFAAYMQGRVGHISGAVGTSGTPETVNLPEDPRSMIGQHINVQLPVGEHANDAAFWIGKDRNRLLVVPRRDHRDTVERQEGLIADQGVARLDAGKTAEVSGTIQRLPATEEMYSWGLTRRDSRELASMGVYLRADSITVQ